LLHYIKNNNKTKAIIWGEPFQPFPNKKAKPSLPGRLSFAFKVRLTQNGKPFRAMTPEELAR
jgi:hypothetical protein